MLDSAGGERVSGVKKYRSVFPVWLNIGAFVLCAGATMLAAESKRWEWMWVNLAFALANLAFIYVKTKKVEDV